MPDTHATPDQTDGVTQRLGIIAGAGRFPFMVMEGAKQAGCQVTVVALRGLADRTIAQRADAFHWAGMARVGRWIRLLMRRGAGRVILAGSVCKSDMYCRFRLLRLMPDWTAARLWFFKIPDKRNDTVLSAVADEFAKHGIIMESCVKYTAEHMAPEGVLTRRQPTAAQLKDLQFGWPIAKRIARLDIGQSIAVKETEVIAVEAIEGTDAMIERAGTLCRRRGWMLIKVAKPNQDPRFDMPTVGPQTVTNLKRNGAAMLVIEAGQTVMIDREKMIAAADTAGITVLGHEEKNVVE